MPDAAVVVSMEVVTPLGIDANDTWDAMMAKTCGIRPMKRAGGAAFDGCVAGELTAETFERVTKDCPGANGSLALALAVRAGQSALNATSLEAADAGRIAVILSTTKADIHDFERGMTDDGYRSTGLYNPAVFAEALARALELDGPAFAVSNACASGLVAIVEGARMLRRNECDAALVVGVDVLAPFILAGFDALGAMSREPSRPFDAKRDGLSLGEGAGAMVLVRGGEAAEPLASVGGWSVTNDANHITGPSRTGEGLNRALRQTLAMAGKAPNEIDYLNAHGTGTSFNDEMEAQAVWDVFGAACPVTSMKGFFGHTLGAAGIVEAVLTIRALHENTVPVSMGMETLGVSKAVDVPSDHLALQNARNALSMKSGFGGVNAVVHFEKV